MIKKLIVLSLVLSPSLALATMDRLKQFKAEYPDFKPASCKICHDGPPRLNSYGEDYRKYGYDFKKIESLDSDGDSFSNIVEINAKTLPGDKDSYPGSDK